MAITFGKKKHKQNNIFHTIVTVVLLCMVFLAMVSTFYIEAEEEAYEMLHMQTKQIKDDLILQIKSDRENLVTMANFASKLYKDGESYDLMFESFKPIGLIENIGILNPDNVFVTKAGSIDLNGKISFIEEEKRGEYISGRIKDLTLDDYEIIRSAVPIKSNDKTVGILYGVIKLDTIKKKYNNMAKELDAQLFVYEKETGELIIDTIHSELANISFLNDRKYNEDYSYEQLRENQNGFSSFVSKYTGENLYLHYSTIEDFNWVINLARYENQVFANAHRTSKILLTAFSVMVLIMFLYMFILVKGEKRRNNVINCASEIRKTLLEINQQYDNISEAIKKICNFAKSRSAFFFDTDGEDYKYVTPDYEGVVLNGEDRNYFHSELFKYSLDLHKINKATIGVMCIKPGEHLLETNPDFYKFLKAHKIDEVSFATVTNKDNHITVLGVINPKKSKSARLLAEHIAVCFSIALFNKKHLNKTEIAATTDGLTGVSNRVAYKKDLYNFDIEKPTDFSCIYIDVNELHLRNNKFGHAAGDEMLRYIANTLKEIFYSHYIYRMGGDEFLVFAQGIEPDDIKKRIERLIEQLNEKEYHVAIGMSYRAQNADTEDMVREAEVRMYEAKAKYYQNKENESILASKDRDYLQINTGISEIDKMISVLKEHYNGIYKVSLLNDCAKRILMPSYLGYNETEENYSELLSKYITEYVHSDFRRAITSFLNYDAIKAQLQSGETPKITYKKTSGETVILSVYKLNDEKDSLWDTLWVFAKD